MRQRVYQHTYSDSWNQGKDWIIEYFEDESFTRNDAEYYEAHLIHQYETYKYFNVAKDDFGLGTWIPDSDPQWTLYKEEDFTPTTDSQHTEEYLARSRELKQKRLAAKKRRNDSLVPVFVDAISEYITDGEYEIRIYNDDALKIADIAKEMNFTDRSGYSFQKAVNILKRNGYEVYNGTERSWANKKNQHKTYHIIRRSEDNEKGT